MNIDDVRNMFRAHVPVRVTDPSRKEAAVAMLLLPVDDRHTEILFIKRATHPDDPWSGQIALPGGRRDPGDADLLRTAIRETYEEIGVDLTGAELMGHLDDLAPQAPQLPPIVVRPYVFGIAMRPDIRPNAEVARHLWVSTAALAESERGAHVRVRGNDLVVPAFHHGGEVIWGMTHRIIKGFLSLKAL